MSQSTLSENKARGVAYCYGIEVAIAGAFCFVRRGCRAWTAFNARRFVSTDDLVLGTFHAFVRI